jgi:hypothetical protein
MSQPWERASRPRESTRIRRELKNKVKAIMLGASIVTLMYSAFIVKAFTSKYNNKNV